MHTNIRTHLNKRTHPNKRTYTNAREHTSTHKNTWTHTHTTHVGIGTRTHARTHRHSSPEKAGPWPCWTPSPLSRWPAPALGRSRCSCCPSPATPASCLPCRWGSPQKTWTSRTSYSCRHCTRQRDAVRCSNGGKEAFLWTVGWWWCWCVVKKRRGIVC